MMRMLGKYFIKTASARLIDGVWGAEFKLGLID